MRMSVSNKWYRSSVEGKTAEEELFVFGYSCKIFRDDEKATYIDQGKHLIPWMGDETLMIDRYDVRGYLHDLKPYEANVKADCDEELAEEEKLCDEERYLALNTDLTEQELYHEEELKRLKAAVASDGAYHEIGFSYDSIEDSNDKAEPTPIKEEPEDEPYSPPEGLKVPKGMHLPSNMKIHAIIEKTAIFVSQQGGQMEIIIKMKQSNNPQFAFMQFDNPLHPYYRHLVQEIKSGHYKPVQEKKVSESDDEQHDGHYLHPSLSGAAENIPKFTVPSINFRRTGDDSYSLLVKNLKDRIEYDAQRNSPVLQEDQDNADSEGDKIKSKSSQPKRRELHVKKESSCTSSDSDGSLSSDSDEEDITPPPPDVKPVIDKMAEYVAKNGVDFETIVKGKNDKRFGFLKPGHKFYNYYMFKKNMVFKSISAAASNATFKEHKNATLSQNVPSPSDTLSNESQSKFQGVSNQLSESDPVATTLDSSSSSVTASSAQEPSEQDMCELDETADLTLSSPPEPLKVKSPVKPVVKGPICFSLKPKDSEIPLLEKPKKPALLLDDSEDEDGDGNKVDTTNVASIEKPHTVAIVHSVASSKSSTGVTVENEEKTKRLTNEEMEAKLAEEKMKDKLAAAVRERLTQQKRDKQLQLERKQRAALFLKMLQKKPSNVSSETAQPLQSFESVDEERPKSVTGSPEFKNGSYSSPVFSEKSSPKDISSSTLVAEPSPVASVQEQWSSSSESEEPAKAKDEEQSHIVDESPKVKPSKESTVHVKKRKKSPPTKTSKSHKSSKKHKRSRSRSPGHKHKSSKSKTKKEKKLPAAYAIVRRSRSRSRSPIRYGNSGRSRSPSHFAFNRWR